MLENSARRILILSMIAVFLVSLLQISALEPEKASDQPKIDVFPHVPIRTRAEDCALCHYSINLTLASGKHYWTSCDTCHDPDIKSELVITTECTDCHGPKHDYAYPYCMNCHDQHAAGFRHDISNHFCQECHLNESVSTDMGPHGWQDCVACHPDHTLDSQACDTCHGKKHSDMIEGGYDYPECLNCHSPMNTTFRHNISNDLCQDCHATEFWKLQSGGHSGENCTECHDQHTMIRTECDQCHGEEHGYTYPKCLECHEPMRATPGPPEFSISQDIIIFSILAIIVSISLSVTMFVIWRKNGGKQ